MRYGTWLSILAGCGLSLGVSAQNGGWREIRCPFADLAPQDVMKQVRKVDAFNTGVAGWNVYNGSQQAKTKVSIDANERVANGPSLRIDYEFIGKKNLEYVFLGPKLTINAGEKNCGLGMWIKDDGTKFNVRIRLKDKSGETHQLGSLRRQKPGWHFATSMFNGKSGCWGGDRNLKLDFPAQLEGIIFDRPGHGFKSKGTLWLGGLSIVKRRKFTRSLKVQGKNVPFGNLYRPGASVELMASGKGTRISWRLLNYYGKVLKTGSGAAAATPISFTLAKQGYYGCRIELKQASGATEAQFFHCAAIDPGMVKTDNHFVGVCSHFRRNAYPLETMALMREYGVRQFRDEISWSSFERKKGVYELPDYGKEFIDRARELKMRPLLIYDYSNNLYENGAFPNSDACVAAFARYAVELTRQTKSVVTCFEVWNEWIGACGMKGKPGNHSAEAYGKVLRETYRAVKKAHPKVTVVGIGGEYGIDMADRVERMAKSAGNGTMEAASVHPYRYPRQPERSDLIGHVSGVTERLKKLGNTAQLWSTEIGWPTHTGDRGSSERMQARYIIRSMALQQASVIKRVYWYDFKDDGLNREYNENNFGIVRHQAFNCSPKPAVVALAVFAKATAGAKSVKIINDGRQYGALYNRPDGTQLLVAWMADGEARVEIKGTVAAIADTMGNSVTFGKFVRLTEDPVYITGKSGITLH